MSALSYLVNRLQVRVGHVVHLLRHVRLPRAALLRAALQLRGIRGGGRLGAEALLGLLLLHFVAADGRRPRGLGLRGRLLGRGLGGLELELELAPVLFALVQLLGHEAHQGIAIVNGEGAVRVWVVVVVVLQSM